jgi:hypothetical protein
MVPGNKDEMNYATPVACFKGKLDGLQEDFCCGVFIRASGISDVASNGYYACCNLRRLRTNRCGNLGNSRINRIIRVSKVNVAEVKDNYGVIAHLGWSLDTVIAYSYESAESIPEHTLGTSA